jgi:hypothetical protein
MTSNVVNNKLVQFISETINFSQFEDILKNETDENNPIRVGWITETGKKRYYDMYWDSAAYEGGNAGGSETKAEMDMYNIQIAPDDWRTLDFNTVYKVRWDNKTYKVNN